MERLLLEILHEREDARPLQEISVMTRSWLMFGLATVSVLANLAGTGRAQEVAPASGVRENNRADFFAKFAITDYDAPRPEGVEESEQRRLKSLRYDNENWVVKEPNPEIDYAKRSIPVSPPPAFPIEESDVIVIGLATAASAYLSNDKTGIYTEYAIRVEQVYKNSSNKVIPGKAITIDRPGGAVRYPDGHRVAYLIAEKKLPSVNSIYALFLRDDKRSGNFEVVTLYELKVDGVVPLDSGFTFADVSGMARNDFMKTLQEKLAKRSDN